MKKDEGWSWSRLRDGITSAILFVSGLICVVAGILQLVADRNIVSIAGLLGLGTVLLFASSIDRFELLKGFGIEAKVRDLNEAVRRADDARESLRQLAELTSAPIISLYSKSGRFGGAPTAEESYSIAMAIRSQLLSLGSGDDFVFGLLKPWIDVMAYDLCSAILQPLREDLNERVSQFNSEYSRGEIAQEAQSQRTRPIEEFRHRMKKALEDSSVKDVAESLSEILRDVPHATPGVLAEVRDTLSSFSSEISEFGQTGLIPSPVKWFRVIRVRR